MSVPARISNLSTNELLLEAAAGAPARERLLCYLLAGAPRLSLGETLGLRSGDVGPDGLRVTDKCGDHRLVVLPAAELACARQLAGGEEDPLFRDRAGRPPSARLLARIVEAQARRAGIELRSLHALRHG
jgi:integrase